MKKTKLLLLTLGAAMILGTTSFAGEWKSDNTGWWYQNDDGSFPANTWQWIDGNGDSLAECYYFDSNGYCLMNTTTPDNSQVDASGAWIVNGVVQTKTLTATAAAPATTETQPAPQETPASSQDSSSSGNGYAVGTHVWLSESGSKYHRINNCGKMNPAKAVEVTTQDAINRGYEKCDKCY